MKKTAMKKKNLTAAAAALTAVLATGASAQDQALTADQCIQDEFNSLLAPISDMPGVKLKLVFEAEALDKVIEHCEKETGTKADFFKGMTQYRENNVTLIFK